MPRLWSETIETHRQAVREATLTAAAELVAEQGLASVTMSAVAEAAGIGRATLYKYFPDVEAILAAWHERQINEHLRHLVQVREQAGTPGEGLGAVLEAYALMSNHQDHGSKLSTVLHSSLYAAAAHQELLEFLRGLLQSASASGAIRADIPAEEMAGYCLHALAAAGGLHSKTAVKHLVDMVIAGLTNES